MHCWRILLSVIAIAVLARPAHAQCASNASSCVTCHETQGLRPVLQSVQPWHVDHVYPLSRGGEHSYRNTQPAHPECNIAKGDKMPIIPL